MSDPHATQDRVRAALDQAIAASGAIRTAPLNAPAPPDPNTWPASGITIPLKEWGALCQTIWELGGSDA